MLCISAACAVVRYLSVCRLACLSRSCILSKQLNIVSNFFHTIPVFPYQTLWQYTFCDPLMGPKISIFYQHWLWHRSLLDRRVLSTFRRWSIGYSTSTSSVSRDQQTPLRHASANLVYDRNPIRYVEDNRTEFIVRTGKSEAEVTNNKRLHLRYCIVLLKLTTDTKHRATSLQIK